MITLVIGGARSGKSEFAENLIIDQTDVCYIATANITDDEMAFRVMKHREQRPKAWRTCEENDNVTLCIGKEATYLLDDITNLISNIMFNMTYDNENITNEIMIEVEKSIIFKLDSFISEIRMKNLNLIMVTNEVGLSIVPENKLARHFRDIQGRVNKYLAHKADDVYFMVAGIEVKVK